MKFFRITTPTLLDCREIVTLGLTTKADGSKIGHKGSGLKFSLAFLHRLGGWLEAKCADYHLKSETVAVSIREKQHQIIQLRSQNSDRIWDTHMTMHAGADTWTEPWFILREMIQNAVDEGGTYEVVEDPTIPDGVGTAVQIPMLPELEAAWQERETWFQPRYPGVIGEGHSTVKGLYFHGFLIYRANEAWDFSYDVTDEILQRSELSEDRQLKTDLYGIFARIVEKMAFDFHGPSVYEKALELKPKEDTTRIYDAVYNMLTSTRKEWGGEHGFKMSHLADVFRRQHGDMAAFTTAEVKESDPNIYYAKAAGYSAVEVTHRLGTILSYHSDIKNVRACLPTLSQRLRKSKTVDIIRKERLRAALRLLKRIRPAGIRVDIVAKIIAHDTINCEALADPTNNRILVMETLLDQDIPDIAKVLIEEFTHLTSGGGDMSLEMQRGLISTIYDLLTRRRKANVEHLVT